MAPLPLYSCFDFLLRSEVVLAELAAATPGTMGRPVVDIRRNCVPRQLPGGSEPVGGLQVAGEEALLTVPEIARYLIRGTQEIVVDPAPGASDRDLRLFLLGSALGIVVHRRGLLPLHANALVIDGTACAFAGHSGAGKSTLAAYFAQAGHRVLCDDVCAVGFPDNGGPEAWPGLPRLKLWSDAAAAFGHDPAALEQVRDTLDKYQVPLPASASADPVPFRRLYLLARAEPGAAMTIERLAGQQAMAAVMAQTYRDFYVRPLGLAQAHFRRCATLLQHAEVYEVRRAWGFDVFEREAEAVLAHMREAAAPAPIATD